MTDLDPRLVAAVTLQLAAWRAGLREGAERVGWKLGMGEGERIGKGPAIGHLTSATQLESGAEYRASRPKDLHADAELMLELGRDVDPRDDLQAARAAIVGFGTALELVDLAQPPDDPEAVVAGNVYHRAFALGPTQSELPSPLEGQLIVNGDVRASASAPTPEDLGDRVLVVARLLGTAGERLLAGDRVISGSVVQVAVAPGDEVVANFTSLGRVRVTIAS